MSRPGPLLEWDDMSPRQQAVWAAVYANELHRELFKSALDAKDEGRLTKRMICEIADEAACDLGAVMKAAGNTP